MEFLQNLHTHTIYGDGKNTPREMIDTAIKKGFKSIGFSEHSNMAKDNKEWCMTERGQESYKQEINSLKEEYKDKIEIFCGIEYDIFSGTDISDFDYAIGSVHGFKIDGEYVEFDMDADTVSGIIEKYFNNDGMLYAKKYFETLAEVPKYGEFDILGHFDIVSKHSEKRDFFDVNSKQYTEYAILAAESLVQKIPYFEVNTGAIARGYRITPYPNKDILKELKRLGFNAVVTADCHDAAMLDCYFEEAYELLKECGFKYTSILTKDGFVPEKL